MIRVTLEFTTYSEAIKMLNLLDEQTKFTVSRDNIIATPVLGQANHSTPTAPTPGNFSAAAPPATQSPTLQQLEQAMIDASERLNDSGAACWALLSPFGVQTIVQLSDHQRQTLYEQVRRL